MKKSLNKSRSKFLFCLVIPCLMLTGSHGSDLEALHCLTWLHRINQVDATIRSSSTVAPAFREMERLKKIAKEDGTQKSVSDYNKAKSLYEQRFSNALSKGIYADVTSQFGGDYSTLVNAYLSLDAKAQRYGQATAQGMSLARQERRIQELDAKIARPNSAKAIGVVTSTFKDTFVKRGSGGSWIRIMEGRQLFLDETIKTGLKGRLRIEMRDRVEQGNRGPTVINVGSDSLIKMEKFETAFTDQVPSRTGVLYLIRGFLRAKTKNWGARSLFSVRTGTSLCGIRGTEVEVRHDDLNKIASYRLLSGVASVSHKRGTTQLVAGSEIVVRNGFAGPPRPFRPL